jgi:hypothetical protein
MSTRERTPDTRPLSRPPAEQADVFPGGETRSAADAFLAASERAINRSLSGSAEEFLRRNRQQNGQ